MNAISLKNEVSSIKRRKCIGCGNCVAKCPSEAIQLNKKEREFTPYPTMDDLFDRIKYRKHKIQETASRKA